MKHLFVFILFLFSMLAQAQQLPIFNLYHVNPYLYNPAEAGNSNMPIIYTGYRKQWTGFEGAPTSYFLTGHISLDDHLNFGLKVLNEDVNVLNTTRVHLTYAYNLEIAKNKFVRFGLDGGFHSNSLNLSKVRAEDFSDDFFTLDKQRESNFDVSFGTHLKWNSFEFAFAFPYLISSESEFEFDENTGVYQQSRHSLVYTSYMIDPLHGKWKYQPMLAWRFTPPGIWQVEGNFKVHYDDKYWVSVGYRQDASVMISVGAKIQDQFLIAYSYGQPNSTISSVAGGNHEVMIGITFKDDAQIRLPRYLSSADSRTYDPFAEPKKKAKSEELSDTSDYEAPKAVLFEYNSDTLTEEFKKKLDELARYMKKNPEKELKLSPFFSHKEYEEGREVSFSRMKKIHEYLISKGVEEDRIKEAHHPIHTHYGMGRVKLHLRH